MTYCNYKSYCLNNIIKTDASVPTDTSIIIKYKNIDGIFFDKEALIRIGKKTSLADSLTVINILNNSIIKRQEEQISNCKITEQEFNQYVISTNKEKKYMVKLFNLKITGKNILSGLSVIGNAVLLGVVLLK